MKTENGQMFIHCLYDQNYNDLRRYLLKLPFNRGLEDDIIQETFLEACKKLDILLSHPCPRGWLFKTALIKSKELKKFYIKQNLCVLNDEAGILDTGLLLENIDFKESILSLVTDEEYCMLILHYVLSYSYKEIGAMYHISTEACKKRIYRLCMKIRRTLSDA